MAYTKQSAVTAKKGDICLNSNDVSNIILDTPKTYLCVGLLT